MVDRKKFEFRKVLGRVSDGLGVENIQALKNLCYDMIGERRREGIDSGIAIFNALIEENLIGPEKAGFLCELLDEVGRKDLTAIVREYMDKLDLGDLTPDKPVDTLETGHLYDIAQDVGRDWMMLSRHLGLDETTIQSIRQSNSHDLREAAYQALLKWKSINGDSATPLRFKRALTNAKLMFIVHKYFESSAK